MKSFVVNNLPSGKRKRRGSVWTDVTGTVTESSNFKANKFITPAGGHGVPLFQQIGKKRARLESRVLSWVNSCYLSTRFDLRRGSGPFLLLLVYRTSLLAGSFPFHSSSLDQLPANALHVPRDRSPECYFSV